MGFMGILLLLLVGYAAGYKEASRLYDVLMNQQPYNKIIRPVRNFNDTLTVFFGLGLLQLMDVDEVNQVITSNVLVSLEWTDIKLTWRPEDFGGVTNLFIPSELLWLPDLLLYNNADGNYVIDIMTKATVFYNGTVRWTPPAIFKSSCHINVEYFPYDIQECSMKFGTWTHNGDQVSLKHMTQKHVPDHDGNVHIDYAISLKDFYPSTEFELLKLSAIRRFQFYPCCIQPFVDVTFNISMRRKTLFYTINLILPCVGIAFLTILVFYLPSQSGAKIALSINILLSLTQPNPKCAGSGALSREFKGHPTPAPHRIGDASGTSEGFDLPTFGNTKCNSWQDASKTHVSASDNGPFRVFINFFTVDLIYSPPI
ncbi:hypothetical protein AAHC03_04697 [Spirometra sp. Aus1]